MLLSKATLHFKFNIYILINSCFPWESNMTLVLQEPTSLTLKITRLNIKMIVKAH